MKQVKYAIEGAITRIEPAQGYVMTVKKDGRFSAYLICGDKTVYELVGVELVQEALKDD